MEDSQTESQSVVLELSEFQDMLRCPVCMEGYDELEHLPKLLNCHHTICLSCLKGIMREAHHQRFPDHVCHSVKRCPQCRTKIQIGSVIERTPTNFYIQTFRHAVNKAQRQNLGTGETNREFVFPQCSTHADNNISIPATTWCEQCRKAVCSMCLVESPHAADHTMILVPEKIRRLRQEADSFLREIEEMQDCSIRNRAALHRNLTRFKHVADLMSESVKKYDENVLREMESIQFPEDVTDSMFQKTGPCDIAKFVDYVQRVDVTKRNVRECVESNRMEEITVKLGRITELISDLAHEIDEFV